MNVFDPRRFWPLLVLSLAVGSSVGCVNSQQFTGGRLPYGSQLASAAPRDPFVTADQSKPNEATRIADASQMRPSSPQQGYYDDTTGMPNSFAAPGSPTPMGASPQMAYASNEVLPQASQPAMRQTAYVPTRSDNPFATSPAPTGRPQIGSPPMSPPAMASPIEQISYEMPAGEPAGISADDPFAEVSGQPASRARTMQMPPPQIVPMNGTADAWQPSVSSSENWSGDGFLPPQ
jgi:hypothetical protein